MGKLDIVARLNNDYVYHKPTAEQAVRYGELREEFRRLAMFIATSCPDSRERSLAFSYLENASFYANASIARNEGQEDEEPDLQTTFGSINPTFLGGFLQ